MSLLSELISAVLACKPLAGLVAACAFGIILLLIFRRKISRRLENAKPADMVLVAIWFFGICIGADAVLGILTEGATWSAMFRNPPDSSVLSQFYDYFSTSVKAVQGKYEELYTGFSPLAILVYRLFGLLIKDKFYNPTPGQYALLLREQVPMMVYLMVVIACMVAGYYMMNRNIRTNNAKMYDSVFAFMLLFSFPVMYSIEIGNILSVSFLLTMFFFCYRDAEEKWVKVAADVCLAVAGALNIAPLVFVFMLTEKREYKRILRVFGICAVLFVAPAFITGFHGMLYYIEEFFLIDRFQLSLGNPSAVTIFKMFGVTSLPALWIVFILTQAVCIVGFLLLPERWEKTLCLTYLILNMPSYENALTSVFVLIPLALLIGREKIRPKDMYFGALMLFICAPLPEVLYFQKDQLENIGWILGVGKFHGANQILYGLFVQLIFIGLAALTVKALIKRIKQKKTS